MDTSEDGGCEHDGSIGKDGSLEVIWKDSPIEKKLQSNGVSNRHSNQSELRGFVHSLISSPSPNKNQTKPKASTTSVAVADARTSGGAGTTPSSISRFIVFSPERATATSTTTTHHDAPAAMGFVTKTPPIHRHKRRKTGNEHEDLMSVLDKLDEEYADTPEKAIESAFESPFSKEAWDTIEQMEIEATQQSIQRHELKPVQTHISPAGDTLKPPPPPPARPAAAPSATPLDYLRCVALEVQIETHQRQKTIRALDDATDKTIVIGLREDWFDTPLQVGDTFHFIFTPSSTSRTDSTTTTTHPTSQPLVADNSSHRIVLHPEILVSPTTVTSSMGCSRRAVLQQTLTMQRNAGAKALVGTLKHQLFQRALESGTYSIPYLIEQSKLIIQSNLLKLLEYGLSTQQASDELKLSFQGMYKWLNQAHRNGIRVKGGGNNTCSALYRLQAVLSIEEPLWSVKYGLKGAVDACLNMQHISHEKANKMMAFELKTGKPTNSIDHIGQVLLYTLLLDERYQGSAEGLLLYLQDVDSTMLQQPVEAHIRGLLHSRNLHAAHLFQARTRQLLPTLLKKTWECQNCFVSAECMLHHAAIEHGSALSSGVPDVFDKVTSHLTVPELTYFKKWIQLLEWESRSNQNTSMLFPQSTEPRLLSNLKAQTHAPGFVELTFGDESANSSSFDAQSDLKIQDRVILSVQSPTHSIFHVAKASVAAVHPSYLRLSLFSAIPATILHGQSVVGSAFSYRVDKDATYSGLQAAKHNVLALMATPDMEAKRKLICHLHPPRFASLSVEARVRRRCLDTGGGGNDCEALLREFYSTMNTDQQKAIEQMLNAKDYSLILGMPGTGKTTAITMAVRMLRYLGLSVLVTSYTHAAVDNLLVKLLDMDVSVLRIGGTPALVHPKVGPHRLEAKSFEHAEQMRQAMLDASVVGCTCLSTHHVLFAHRKFDVCIVDEASQITQPVLLGALQHATVFCLVGDHYQLPPLVVDAQAKTGGLDWSLFKCLSEAHPQASTVLGYQYRMNQHIMLLANRLIYNNQLKYGGRRGGIRPSGASSTSSLGPVVVPTRQQPPAPIGPMARATTTSSTTSTPPWISQVLSPEMGVVFVNTDSLVPTSDGIDGLEVRQGRSIINPTEARVVLGLAGLLCQQQHLLACDNVTILSPFRSQVQYLSQFQTAHEISTIDTYQGKDKRVVFVSFVRSNRDGHVGDLLLDWRRINVALTRAKDKLVLVGSKATLRQSPVLHALLTLVDQQHWGIDVPCGVVGLPHLVAGQNKIKRVRQGAEMGATTSSHMYTVVPPSDEIENLVGGNVVRVVPSGHRFQVSRNIMEEG